MAIKSAPFYWYECDECGTSETVFDAVAWQTPEGAKAAAEWWDWEWLITDDGHWCPDCRAKHESEDGDE